MLVVLEVWQAILVKKLDLDSSWVKQSMSEGARNLLKVCLPCPSNFILLVFFSPVPPSFQATFWMVTWVRWLQLVPS